MSVDAITSAQRLEVRRHVGYSRFDEWNQVEPDELSDLWLKSEGDPLICAALILEALAADEDDLAQISLGRYSEQLGGAASPKAALLAQAGALRAQAGQTLTPVITPWRVER